MIQDFIEEGYLIVPQYISSKKCEELKKESDLLANGQYSQILNIHTKIELFYSMIVNPEILEMADNLTGHTMIPVGSIFFFCKPGNELEQGSNFHQDNYAAQANIGSYLTCGLALDDADESNGALQVYPRSHTMGNLECIRSKNFEFDTQGNIINSYPVGNKSVIPEWMTPKILNYKKGSLIFIHSNIIHGAPKNPSPDKWRRMYYMNYIKDGHAFWPGWSAKRQIIDRNKNFKEYKI